MKYRLTYNPMDAKSYGCNDYEMSYEFDSNEHSPSAVLEHWIGANKRLERIE